MSALKYYRLFSPLRRIRIDPFEYSARPSRFFENHFGWETSLVPPEIQRIFNNPGQFFNNFDYKQAVEIENAAESTVKYGKDKFQAVVDVKQFKPQEITVKVTGGDTITVEGRHEEKEDTHGYVSRHFVRRYVLPKGHDVSLIESTLSSDGVLTISAPKIAGEVEEEGTSVPITETGKPAMKAVGDDKKTEDK